MGYLYSLRVALAAALLCAAGSALAGEEGGAPPTPVNTQTNPDALLLNARNPLAIHAGPGKPNVGSAYIPPSVSGKEKKAKAGETEKKVMGAEPTH